MSITKKISLVVALVSVTCAVVIGWISYRIVEQAVRQEVGVGQLAMARSVMDKIDQFLYERQYDMHLLSHAAVTLDAVTGVNRGNTLEGMTQVAVGRGPWQRIEVIDLSLTVVASTNKEDEKTTLDNSSNEGRMFARALEGMVVYSDVMQVGERGERTMLFAAPIRDPNSSELEGVLMGYLAWQVVEEFLLTNQAHAVLVNSEGVVIAQNHAFNQSSMVGQDLSQTDPVLHLLEGEEEHNGIALGFSGEYKSLTSHVVQLGHLDFSGNGWGLIFELPTTVAFDDVLGKTVNLLMVLTPLLLVSAVAIVWLLRLSVVFPLIALNQAAIKMKQGDYSGRVRVTSSDEVGQLGESFNQLAAQVSQSQGELEQRVTEKTAALEKQMQTVQDKNRELEELNEVMLGREAKMVELKQELERAREKNE